MENQTGKNAASHVRKIVDGLIGKWEKGTVKRADALIAAWGSSATEDAKCHSRPVSFKNGVLTVVVENAPWMYRLTLEKNVIRDKMNQVYAGRKKIQEIRFRIGRIEE